MDDDRSSRHLSSQSHLPFFQNSLHSCPFTEYRFSTTFIYIYITFILYNIGRFYPPLINYNRSTCNYRSPSHFTSKYIYNNFRLFVFIIIVVVAVVFDLSLSNRSLAVLSPSSTQSHHFKYGGSIKIFLLSST